MANLIENAKVQIDELVRKAYEKAAEKGNLAERTAAEIYGIRHLKAGSAAWPRDAEPALCVHIDKSL